MNDNPPLIKNSRGLTIVELLISIGVGSVVIMMLMSILSTSLLTKNMADHENRLLNESYYISEYIQQRIFELGVRSIEDIPSSDPDDQTLRLNHEYDLRFSESGVVYRNFNSAEAFILHYDSSEKSIYYGSDESFDYENHEFLNPDETRINSSNVTVDSESTIDFTPITEDDFEGETKISGAIIRLNITLNYRIDGNPLFKPMRFETSIVF
ncbi:MAG: PilW family protein [Bacillota bacterium]